MSYTKENYYQPQYPVAYQSYPGDARTDVERGELEDKPSWNWSLHCCSAFTMLCCGWFIGISSCFGLGSLLCSISAYTDYKANDFKGYRYKRRCAIGWMVAGMLMGAAVLAIGGYYIYAYYSELMQLIQKQLP